jgi:polysaccharide export outer membrane protein
MRQKRRQGIGDPGGRTTKMTARLAVLLIFACAMQAQETQRTAPMIDASTANLPAQAIGGNDLIAISVYGSPELTRTVRVGADGDVRLPLLSKPIHAEGLMPAELETLVAESLKAAQLLVDPLVTVTVVEYQSRPISVMGAVRKPLTFQATSKVTLLEALARAEGLSPDAGHEILVSRPGTPGAGAPLMRRIPVKALLADSDPELNLKLAGGEEIRVPTTDKVFIVGNVKKPGAFAVGEEAGTSILKAVAMAEGLMPYAAKEAVIYRREIAGNVNEQTVDIGKIMARKAADVTLLPNDVLYIPEAKGARLGWATLEKVLLFGSGAATALIYGAAVH